MKPVEIEMCAKGGTRRGETEFMNAKFQNVLVVRILLTALYVVLVAMPIIAQEKEIPRGSKVVVRNDYGGITITGWERTTMEVVATDASRAETVSVSISENFNKILVTAAPDTRYAHTKVNLEIKLPRYVELEPISTVSDDITIVGVNGAVNVKTDSGKITVRQTGAINAQTSSGEIFGENIAGDFTAKSGSGNIRIAQVEGFIDVNTANGNVEMRRVKGGVKIASINGKILVQCVDGAVEINDTSGQIRLLNVTGGVDVSTSNGRAEFFGTLNRTSRYRLKTLSGSISMLVPDDAAFTAVLSSYRGHIETDFDLQPDSEMSSKTNRRGIIRRGGGEARIEMDSFDGAVRLGKIVPGAIEKCEVTKK